jgi:hypothetical protein
MELTTVKLKTRKIKEYFRYIHIYLSVVSLFLGKNIPNDHKIYQMASKYTKWPQNIPNGRKIYQMATKYTKWL